jgi:hypothetical protein
MSRLVITTLILSIFAIAAAAQDDNFTLTEIVRDYDPVKDVTTVRLRPSKLSGPTDHYHSLTFSVSYAYAGKGAAQPKDFELELVSIVKARELNSDLYVLFVVDGEEIHFSSNRSAIRNPVRGKPWIGERMVFGLPREKYVKLAGAKKLSVKLGGVSFDFSEDQIADLRRILWITH